MNTRSRSKRKHDCTESTDRRSLENLLEVKFINSYIGSGVFAKSNIDKGTFVCNYIGERIDGKEGESRLNSNDCPVCYLYFFRANGKHLCVDATKSSCIGRYINDDHKRPNCKVVLEGLELAIYTIRNILKGEELRYDYGDKQSFWRKKRRLSELLYDPPKSDHVATIENTVESSSQVMPQSIDEEPVNKVSNNQQESDYVATIEHTVDSSCQVMQQSIDEEPVNKVSNSHLESDHDATIENTVESSSQVMQQSIDEEPVNKVSNSHLENDYVATIENTVESSCQVMQQSVDEEPFNKVSNNLLESDHDATIENTVESSSQVMQQSIDEEPVNKVSNSHLENDYVATIENTVESSCQVMQQSVDEEPFNKVSNNLLESDHVATIENTVESSSQVMQQSIDEEPVNKVSNSHLESDYVATIENTVESSCQVMQQSVDEEPVNKVSNNQQESGHCSSIWDSNLGIFIYQKQLKSKRKTITPEPKKCLHSLGSITDQSTTDSSANHSEMSDTENDQEFWEIESLGHDSIKDPDYSHGESDDQYISEDDYVSDSDNSQTVPFLYFPKLQLKHKSEKNCSEGVAIEKKLGSDRCETITCPESPVHDSEVSSTHEEPNTIKLQPCRNEDGKRVWDKLHYCVFCDESFTNLTKHILGRHKSESEVVRLGNMQKNSKERKNALLKLRNAGDYNHNVQVLRSGKGTLITWSRKPKENSPEDYLPCEDCLAFFLRESLWRHRKNCPLKKAGSSSRRVQSSASLLLPVAYEVSAGLKKNVLKKMASDEVTMAVRNDRLILRVGEKLFQKHGHQVHLSSYISQKMRELGRFLLNARKIDPCVQNLNDVLVPEKYLKVTIEATRALCKYNTITNTYGNPSLALKLQHLLKKCTRIKKSEALIERDSESGRQADDFLSLIENEWNDEVSSSALDTLKETKMNKGQVLPLTEDILKIQEHLQKKTDTLVASLEKNFTKQAFDELNQITLTRLVLFNRRRAGETQRVTVEAFESKFSSSDTLKDVAESLSPVEKMLCATFSRIEIRGKKGRTVPVLLTQDFETCINTLLKYRKDAGIQDDNPYLFARTNYGSKDPIRSTDVLRKFANEADLKCPKSITSTKLRKHIATVSQILNLNEQDMETITQFMGHNIDVHRAFYRLPQETVQIIKMGKLLNALDRGTIAHYRGMSLEEVPFEEDAELSSGSETDNEAEDGENEEEEEVPGALGFTGFVGYCDAQQESATRAQQLNCTGISSEGKSKCVQRLTEDQSALLRGLFKTNISLRRELRREECEKVIHKFKELSNFSWLKIKNTVHNWITAKKEKGRHWFVSRNLQAID